MSSLHIYENVILLQNQNPRHRKLIENKSNTIKTMSSLHIYENVILLQNQNPRHRKLIENKS